ncbi:MAG: glyoxalase [Marmoricola sp.]
MATIDKLVIEADDVAAAEVFYKALGVEDHVTVRESTEATAGFRGFTVSLVCAQPGNVDAFVSTALEAGATAVKAAAKSFWGYGAVLRAPDGTLWKVAASSKKDSAPVEQRFEDLVLLLGVADVKATKQFYADRGLGVAKSFGSKYVEFDAAPVKLALYGRKAAAKDAGVNPEGSGSHRLAVIGSLGDVMDPDGFVWENR